MEREKKSKATEPPMCKLCKTRHWFREPHQWAKKKRKKNPRRTGG